MSNDWYDIVNYETRIVSFWRGGGLKTFEVRFDTSTLEYYHAVRKCLGECLELKINNGVGVMGWH